MTEKCGLCGQPIDPGDADCVQVHGGSVGGLLHESCLQEYDPFTCAQCGMHFDTDEGISQHLVRCGAHRELKVSKRTERQP